MKKAACMLPGVVVVVVADDGNANNINIMIVK